MLPDLLTILPDILKICRIFFPARSAKVQSSVIPFIDWKGKSLSPTVEIGPQSTQYMSQKHESVFLLNYFDNFELLA